MNENPKFITKLSDEDRTILDRFDFINQLSPGRGERNAVYEETFFDGQIPFIHVDGCVHPHIDYVASPVISDPHPPSEWVYFLIVHSKDSVIYTTDAEVNGRILQSVFCRVGDIIRLNTGQWHGLIGGDSEGDDGSLGLPTWAAFVYDCDTPDDSSAIAYFDQHIAYLEMQQDHDEFKILYGGDRLFGEAVR
jgi:hypothetical protein